MAAASKAQARFQLKDRLLVTTLQLQHLQGAALLDTRVHHLHEFGLVHAFVLYPMTGKDSGARGTARSEVLHNDYC